MSCPKSIQQIEIYTSHKKPQTIHGPIHDDFCILDMNLVSGVNTTELCTPSVDQQSVHLGLLGGYTVVIHYYSLWGNMSVTNGNI